MPKRLLFVDDEPKVLEGLQRSLRPMRREWEMEFADGGVAALAAMERNPVDVVVTDMRMPGMDGAELLERVKTQFPRTVRIVLSGQSNREAVLRSIAPAHQYLSKPCDIDELKQKLTRTLALQDLLHNPTIKEVVSQLRAIPSLPSLYLQITRELQSAEVSLHKIAETISQDMGMSARILQLINSAFFGMSCRVSSPFQAVSLLGLDNIRALVLTIDLFAQLDTQFVGDLGSLWKHSFQTGAFAKAIARCQGVETKIVDEAFTAGLLHDIGKLILASALSEHQREVLQTTAGEFNASDLEQQSFGCTHGEVGAYLLGLWGLPDPIVEAVAWHHTPSNAAPACFCPLIAVHVADVVQGYDSCPESGEQMQRTLLEELGLQDQIPVWIQACRTLEQS